MTHANLEWNMIEKSFIAYKSKHEHLIYEILSFFPLNC